MRDIAAAWTEFSRDLNGLLLGQGAAPKGETPNQAGGAAA